MNEQLFVTIAAGPLLSLINMLASHNVQNVYLIARVADIETAMRDIWNARARALRAETAKNQSELSIKFSDLNYRFERLEQTERR